MKFSYLENKYRQNRSRCVVCGCQLEAPAGEPLGRYFVMDIYGKFFCAKCDHFFEDGDERIYVPEEELE